MSPGDEFRFDVPKRTACVANNNGYGPHETTWPESRGVDLLPIVGAPRVYICKHCGSLYAVRSP